MQKTIYIREETPCGIVTNKLNWDVVSEFKL